MKPKKIIYYEDELNDEFSESNIIPKRIDENYKYIHKNPLWNFASLILQNILFVPLKVLHPKIKFRIKYIGKEKITKYKKTSYFIYANHTQIFGDTHIPSNPIYPKRNFFIVNSENISMKGLGTIVELLGAIPVPDNKEAMKNFLEAIEYHLSKGHAITIYPEAHIWPYYTKIRPFKSVSFRYPVEYDKPVFCMTNTYQKRGKNKVKITTYIDGPFFANKTLKTAKEQKEDLRNRIYNCMVARSKNSNYEYIEYRKKLIIF